VISLLILARQDHFMNWVRNMVSASGNDYEDLSIQGAAGASAAVWLAISSLYLLHNMIGVLELCFAKRGTTGRCR
jgi:hypothetical protein